MSRENFEQLGLEALEEMRASSREAFLLDDDDLCPDCLESGQRVEGDTAVYDDGPRYCEFHAEIEAQNYKDDMASGMGR